MLPKTVLSKDGIFMVIVITDGELATSLYPRSVWEQWACVWESVATDKHRACPWLCSISHTTLPPLLTRQQNVTITQPLKPTQSPHQIVAKDKGGGRRDSFNKLTGSLLGHPHLQSVQESSVPPLPQMHHDFTLLPSGRHFRTLNCRLNKYNDSFVPNDIMLNDRHAIQMQYTVLFNAFYVFVYLLYDGLRPLH